MPPALLAFDTATEHLAVALQAGGRRWHVDAPGGPAASTRLIPQVMALLAEAGIGVAQLAAIGFGRGPGAFTGLRTACAVAQGLALAHDTPVLPIDSLLLVADDARQQAAEAGEPTDGPWWAAMDARMDEVYAACFRHGAEGWQVDTAPALYTLPALAARWQANPPARVAGNAAEAFGDRLPLGAARQTGTVRSRAAALLRLAEAAWAAGAAVAPDAALPLYLRDKVALTTAERTAERLAQRAAAAGA